MVGQKHVGGDQGFSEKEYLLVPFRLQGVWLTVMNMNTSQAAASKLEQPLKRPWSRSPRKKEGQKTRLGRGWLPATVQKRKIREIPEEVLRTDWA